MRRPSFIIVAAALGILVLPLLAGAATVTDYLLVKDLPIIGDSTNIATYLKGLFRLGLALAVVFAVVMIVINGIKYMVSDIITEKMAAKDIIRNAFAGLLIIFLSVIGLNTINPQLTQFNLQATIDRTIEAILSGRPADYKPAPGGPPPAAGCGNCVPVPAGIPIKTPIACGSNCQVSSTLASRLQGLATNLQNKIDWRVTEAFPPQGYSVDNPKGIHQSACHGNGTCVDANFDPFVEATAGNINTFIQAATGLRVVYEVKTNSERQRLIDDGVPASNIQTVPGINAPHFSVYQSNQ